MFLRDFTIGEYLFKGKKNVSRLKRNAHATILAKKNLNAHPRIHLHRRTYTKRTYRRVCPFCGGQRWVLACARASSHRQDYRLHFCCFYGCSSREPPRTRRFFCNTPPTTKEHPDWDALLWWAEVDSNHRSRRRQIYSLIHLATLESAHMLGVSCKWSR